MKRILTLAALITGAVFAATPPKPAPAPKYCEVLGFRDYEVLLGRAAFLRVRPGCNRPGLVRKVSDANGAIYEPFEVPVLQPSTFPPRVWLFASHLEYSLEGKIWLRLKLIP